MTALLKLIKVGFNLSCEKYSKEESEVYLNLCFHFDLNNKRVHF